ncbi:MAG: cold shock domain-containing protein [Acidimicrobiia bacterium]|nr:cold shock domain-containing protein [Acidimicrobiia bacterium]
MQGVILSFDPKTNTGLIMRDTVDRTVYQMAPNALNESLFTTLRQGQRVNFDILENKSENEDSDSNQFATNVRLGSEIDMGISTARV